MSALAEPRTANGTHILLVEKDPLSADSVGHFLERDGHTVTTVFEGKRAFELADELQPDLILSEIIIPGINGLELCEMLQKGERTGHIPVVILSVLGAAERALRHGAARFIQKPIKQSELVAEISEILLSMEGRGNG